MTIDTLPDDQQAHAFATMLLSGLTAPDAIGYFLDGDEDPVTISELIRKWRRSRRVQAATRALLGKAFHEMSSDEQMSTALKVHYSQLSALLFSSHYAEASAMDKAKLDSARTAIEAKVAGTAGKGDALARFFDDINTGRVKLSSPVVPMRTN